LSRKIRYNINKKTNLERENMAFKFNLEQVLNETGITKSYLSRESKIRYQTVLDLESGKTKRLELPSVENLLNTINRAARDIGITKTYTIDDLIQYEFQEDSE
jgi:predicted transcriptional regulator